MGTAIRKTAEKSSEKLFKLMKFCTAPNFHLTDLSLYHIILCPDLRRGCENALRHPGSYPGDLHAGHLHPHHRRYAETSGGDRGGIPGRHFRRGAETVGRKRKNGEGTVRLRKDGRWEGRVVIGYDDKGLPKTKNVLAKTKSECVEKLKTLKDALAPPAPPRIKADMPFGDWMEHWYETHSRPAARPGTRRIYEGYLRLYINPGLGHIPLNRLTAKDTRSVHALCNLIDVCADFLQLGGHCFHVAVIQPDHIAVYEHFPRINGKTARSHLLHFTLDHCPFLGSHRNAQHNIPRSVCHLFTVLSAPNKGLGLSQQAKHRQVLFRECGYTPYACYGISLTTITAAQPQFGKPQVNFFKRKTP